MDVRPPVMSRGLMYVLVGFALASRAPEFPPTSRMELYGSRMRGHVNIAGPTHSLKPSGS